MAVKTHTPGRWQAHGNRIWSSSCKDRGSVCTFELATGNHIPDDQNEVNAEFVAKAVNSFEQMRDALEALRKFAIGYVWQPLGMTGDESDWFQCEMCGARTRGNAFVHRSNCVIAQVDAALAAASGENKI